MTTGMLIVLMALLVGCLTAAATAVRSTSRIWLRHWVDQTLSGATSELHLDRPKRWLSAAGIGIAALVFATGAVIGLGYSWPDTALPFMAAILLLMTVGQLIPRAFARRWAAPLATLLLPMLRALAWSCTPLFSLARLLTRSGSAIAPAPAGDHDSLDELLREGELEGVGEASESAIISGVVEFGAKLASEVMTRRQDIVAVGRSTPAAEITRMISQSNYSRLPVYDGDLDHVVGLVHSFDALANPEWPVESLRRVAHTRDSTPCPDLMRRMLREHVHLAIIQGEADETVGLVTLEDLLEELVGDIRDEHDEPQPVTA